MPTDVRGHVPRTSARVSVYTRVSDGRSGGVSRTFHAAVYRHVVRQGFAVNAAATAAFRAGGTHAGSERLITGAGHKLLLGTAVTNTGVEEREFLVIEAAARRQLDKTDEMMGWRDWLL